MYEAEDAELYDLVHQGRGKDYEAEAASIVAVVREWHPGAGSLLDVACGTGGHLRHFEKCFGDVEGVDRSPDMLAYAARRVPGVRLHPGDMRTFRLGRTFSAVTCLFSSIGHMRTTEELAETLACFAAHVEPGGVVVVDPWWFPDTFLPGYVAGAVIEDGTRTVARVSHSSLEGNATRMSVEYLVAESGAGIRRVSESTLITLFTREEYEHAFDRAGLTPHYLDSDFSGRGLFVAVRRP
ncbi:class I SAM-dependent methyltransferase [Streptomyces sp. NPDC056503]|uniref:class I SAM-dependent methyltransferase n=1 Tax=Streptomyces sp. NPDC056503 TaxID=3345842 RepID=UPI0036BEA884